MGINKILVMVLISVFFISACTSEPESQEDEDQYQELPEVPLAEDADDVQGQKEVVFEQQIVNDEPIVLTGDDVLEIINTDYTHRNSIILEDNAKLIIRNSRFYHEKEYGFQYELKALNNSRVIVENSEVGNECTGSLNWNFFDNSGLDAVNITQYNCNIWVLFTSDTVADIENWNFFGGTVCDNSDVKISDSEKMELELCYPDGSEFDVSLPTEINEFSFPQQDDKGITSTLAVMDSSVDGWGLTLVPGSDVTIRDSPAVTIGIMVGLPWENTEVVLDGLYIGDYTDKTWEINDARLRLVNTTAYGWETNVFAYKNTLIVRNSNVTGPTLNSDHSKMIVENSVIGGARSQEYVEMTISDTVVTGDVIATENSEIMLINTKVEGFQQGDNDLMFGNIIATGNSKITLINTTFRGELIEKDSGKIITE